MLNSTINQNSTLFGSTVTLTGIILSSIGILFNIIVIIILINYGKFTKRTHKNNSRRIGLLHSINTYIHLIGILTTLLIMSIRTLYGDLYLKEQDENYISWHCHILAYLMPLFAAGVYGSCFLQAIFRFCRIIIYNRNLFRKISLHIQLILIHWIFIIILLLPILPRSIYIPSDYFCFIPFNDRWTSIYIVLITAIIPVSGIFILYVKILLYLRHHLKTKKQWRRIKRDILTIRRILLLVIIILQTSSTGIILWIFTFFDEHVQRLFYRLLRFLIILCMIICSITLLIVSPQLKRALRLSKRKYQKKYYTEKQQNTSSNNMEEASPYENLSNS